MMSPYTSYSTPSGGQATTDAYADTAFMGQSAGERDVIIRAITSGPLSFHLQNTGANSITYTVIASNDLTFADAKWIQVVAPAAIAAAGVDSQFLDTGRFLFYKVQVKATVGGSQGTLVAACVAKRF